MDKLRATEVFIAETLKEQVNLFLGNGEIADDEKTILISLLRTIEYMSLHSDFEKYYAEKLDDVEIALGKTDLMPNEFTVTCVDELEDGSAKVNVKMGDEVRHKLFEEGLNFILIKSILGCTTDEVLDLAQRGLQEKKTDDIMKRYAEARASLEKDTNE